MIKLLKHQLLRGNEIIQKLNIKGGMLNNNKKVK